MYCVGAFWNLPFKSVSVDVDGLDLSFLAGKKIVNIGYLDTSSMMYPNEENFAIDYIDDDVENRVVLGANDLGIWIAWKGQKNAPNDEDLLKKKIDEVYDEFEDKEIILELVSDKGIAFICESETKLTLNRDEISLMPESIQQLLEEKADADEILGCVLSWLSF